MVTKPVERSVRADSCPVPSLTRIMFYILTVFLLQQSNLESHASRPGSPSSLAIWRAQQCLSVTERPSRTNSTRPISYLSSTSFLFTNFCRNLIPLVVIFPRTQSEIRCNVQRFILILVHSLFVSLPLSVPSFISFRLIHDTI